jgi:predicted nucleotide-binding protein
MATPDELRTAIALAEGLTLQAEVPIANGIQFKLAQGPVICLYNTGKAVLQGRNKQIAEGLVASLPDGGGAGSGSVNRSVFVVYGHDVAARDQLEAMLRRWGLTPIVLDQLTSEGDTLIEKLERYQRDVAFAVVLATPDDEGHPVGQPTEKKLRARQNVVMELGMMLAKLGRRRVAVLLKQTDIGVMERPSDIAGLIYIPFSDSVDDARVQLAKEMNKQGLVIDLDKL